MRPAIAAHSGSARPVPAPLPAPVRFPGRSTDGSREQTEASALVEPRRGRLCAGTADAGEEVH